jgi:hypothetical protein
MEEVASKDTAGIEEAMTTDTIKLRTWLSDVVTAALKVPTVEDVKLQAWADAISVKLDNVALAAIRELNDRSERPHKEPPVPDFDLRGW